MANFVLLISVVALTDLHHLHPVRVGGHCRIDVAGMAASTKHRAGLLAPLTVLSSMASTQA